MLHPSALRALTTQRGRLPYRGGLVLFMVLLALASTAADVRAQAPLTLTNDETTVRGISFNFVGSQSYSESQLKDQIALTEPSFTDRLDAIPIFGLLFDSDPHPFDPVTLARDVVRLRNYYARNGFLQADISYPASQLDTTNNTIHVIFRVEEGPPLIIQDVNFFGTDGGYAVNQFDEAVRDDWIDFRDANTFRTGERFTQFKYVRIQSDVMAWLRNNGYAFPTVSADSTVDRASNTIDIDFRVDPGPRGRISEIHLQGNESVSDNVVLRELPFNVGDRFDQRDLTQGQRELFALNLFRVALVDVPAADTLAPDTLQRETVAAAPPATSDTLVTQPRDSTVQVRVRVREADLRYVSARSGYGGVTGLSTEATWTHRNFFGNARTFSANLLAETGAFSTGQNAALTRQLYQATLSLRQPYLFRRNLSGIVSPFIRYEDNELLQASDTYRGINAREFGLETTLIYEFFPLRTVSLQHTLARVTQFAEEKDTLRGVEFGPYNRSILTLSGTLGQIDDEVSPSSGFRLRPYVEFGSLGVNYYKIGGETTGYLPLPNGMTLAGRLTAGQLWSQDNQIDPQIEDRYDDIRLYAGGANDLRGWAQQNAGPKFARPTTADSSRFRYESIGARRKLGGNVELRLPLSFWIFGEGWSTVAFFDAAYIDTGLDEAGMREIARQATGLEEEAYDEVSGLTRGALQRTALRYGTGLGLRYETIVGFVRLDVAYQLNPDPLDLRDPADVYAYETGQGPRPGPSLFNRLAFHLSIGQAF